MDAADILGAAPRSEFRARSRPATTPQEKDAAKLKGLKREVYHLTGQTVEASKPVVPVHEFGKKRSTLQRKVHWEFAGFSNSARTDGLMLRHWQKKGIKWEDYPFARFNKKVQLLVYSDEEYEALLRSEQWTREQTDDLMLLVQQFHLNFFLVQDRWQGSGSVDWLKDRYYEVQRKLHESRELPPPPEDNPLLSKPFNREWEEERKQQMLAASQRSKEVDKEEAAIIEKARKIEATLKRKRIAEKASSSRARDKGAQVPNRKPLPPVGGVALRSSMVALGAVEPQNAAAILDAIGLQLPVACHDPEVCAAASSLVKDLNTLLSWHQRSLDTRRHMAKGGSGGAFAASSPLPSPTPKAGGALAGGEDEERSSKKARRA